MSDIELRINKTPEGKYKMTITKDYISGSKQELISKISTDFKELINEFEKLKLADLGERE